MKDLVESLLSNKHSYVNVKLFLDYKGNWYSYY